MEKEYYQEQINKIKLNSEFFITIQIKEGDIKTNNLFLNKISAEVLINWLQKNFT